MKRINILRYVAWSLLGVFAAGSAMGEESKLVQQKAVGVKQSCVIPFLEPGFNLDWERVEGTSRSCLELVTSPYRYCYEDGNKECFEVNPLSQGWSVNLSSIGHSSTRDDKIETITYAYKATFKSGKTFSGTDFEHRLALLAATLYKNADRSLPCVKSGAYITEKVSVTYTIPGDVKEITFEKSPEELAKLLGLSKL